MKKYKVITSCLKTYFSVGKGDVLSQANDEGDWLSNKNAGFTDNTFKFLLVNHASWFQEEEEPRFTREDMKGFARFVNGRMKTKDKTLDWPELYLSEWLGDIENS